MKRIVKLGTIFIAAFTLAACSNTATTKTSQSKSVAVEATTHTSTEKAAQKKAEKDYDGKNQTIDVNDGKPTFTTLDLQVKKGGWEKYGDLDTLNRATSGEALLNQKLMPTEKRKSIQNVKPTGWHSKKIDNGYLYNRTHLIGFALSGENANWKNLITGTRQLNSPEMLHLEMDIKTYLEKSDKNYVRYSVVPVFKDDELVARGVHMQAQSIDSDAVSFNVYIHNVQKDVTIDYANGNSQTKTEIQTAKKAEKKKKQQEKIAAQQAVEKKEQEEQARKKAAEEQAKKEQEQQEAAAQKEAEEQEQAQEDTQANDQTERTVYIAPQSGSKYHFDPNCRGLNNANSVVSMDIDDAKAQGYTLCGWED